MTRMNKDYYILPGKDGDVYVSRHAKVQRLVPQPDGCFIVFENGQKEFVPRMTTDELAAVLQWN